MQYEMQYRKGNVETENVIGSLCNTNALINYYTQNYNVLKIEPDRQLNWLNNKPIMLSVHDVLRLFSILTDSTE